MQQRSQERFDALVDAAGHLVSEKGVDDVSMTDIAAQAGVALTAAYRYFPNKQSVIRELALRSFEADYAVLQAFSDRGDKPLRDWIEEVVRTYGNAEVDNAGRLQLRAAVHANVELAQLNFEDSRTKAGQVAAALIDAGVAVPRPELEQRALLLIKLFDGAISLARAVEPDQAESTIDRFARLASGFLLDGSDPTRG